MISQFEPENNIEIKKRKSYILFENEWRVPLNKRRKDVFYMLSSIDFSGYILTNDVLTLTPFTTITNFNRCLNYLVNECYIKIDKKYKKIDGIIYGIIKVLCFDPQGNIYKNV